MEKLRQNDVELKRELVMKRKLLDVQSESE